jgi:D-glycero-alpha-D-manno-heptose-7-phosphate kinase
MESKLKTTYSKASDTKERVAFSPSRAAVRPGQKAEGKSTIIRSKAPLRLGLAGGGTDVSPFSDIHGGSVLNATIDMHAYCTIEATDNHQIVFFAADRDEYEEHDSSEHLDISDGLLLHRAVYNRIIKQFNEGQPLSFRMTTYSDAVAGSGLGSSSTIVVAMIKAYAEWLNLPLGEYDIAQLAYQIERRDAGLSGGKQDQYAATFGGFNFIEFLADDQVIVNPLRIKHWIINELESSFVLFYTGSSRESANIIDEQIKNTTEKNKRSVDAMLELKADSIVMKEALLKGDFLTFSRYLAKSWEAKKKMAASISNPGIDAIYNMALEAGAYGGKVSGAGGGGFMMLMVNPVNRIRLIEQLNKQNGRVMNFHFTKYGTQAWRM